MKNNKQTIPTIATNYLKAGLVSALFAGGVFVALGSTPSVSAASYTGNKTSERLNDTELYERAKTLKLPKYITGSLYGILNQNSSVTYPKDEDGLDEPEVPKAPKETRRLNDTELYERAKTLKLPKYITGSLYGNLNHNSSVTYPKDEDGLE
ncbi:hypothetical protein [Streptococcus porcinus]|uniref:hypothetical protein n=1 Tax=Streptococcus porcinus TaxID=1340 RepID=UPI001961A4CF|nr:hypothetical protein [Streptococcus porcinus]